MLTAGCAIAVVGALVWALSMMLSGIERELVAIRSLLQEIAVDASNTTKSFEEVQHPVKYAARAYLETRKPL